MINVSVYYPLEKDRKFDFDYYCNSHVPMVQGLLGPACKSIKVEKGIAGGSPPGSQAPNIAVTQMIFDSMESFQAAFAAHAERIFADTSNYTNIEPKIQFGKILIDQ